MRLRLFALAVTWLLAACAVQSAQPTDVQSTELIETLAPPTALATSAVTTPGPRVLKLWWPDLLAPVDNGDAADLLAEQISGFQTANHDVAVDFRLRKAQDVGGIMSTIRAASLVASGALPDLTLLRRSDLMAAAQAGLIVPIDEHAVAAVLDNLRPMVAALGRVNDQLYGVPYNIEIEHLAYQTGLYSLDRWDFADVLSRKAAFVFPAGRASSLSDVFLMQYRDATGTLDSSTLNVDPDQLRTLFEFYQQAVSDKLIDPMVLEYIAPTDYRVGLENGDIPAGVVTSSLYLRLLADGAKLDFAPIPTQSGQPTTLVDGWMWVLMTADAGEQDAALRFLNWMLDSDRQGRYNQAISMLPSQPTALRRWEDANYAAFVDSLLSNATLPLADSSDSATARAVQSALASVISGQRSAAQAAQDVATETPTG